MLCLNIKKAAALILSKGFQAGAIILIKVGLKITLMTLVLMTLTDYLLMKY
jgi:hypothetical protein